MIGKEAESMTGPTSPIGPIVLVALVCFGALGGLTGRRISGQILPLAGSVVAGVLFALLALLVLTLLVYVVSPRLWRKGPAAVFSSVATGFLMLTPFTVLALIAEFALGWNAVQAFTTAGIMGSGVLAGSELGKRGGGGLISAFAPSLGCIALATLWIVLGVLAKGAWKG